MSQSDAGAINRAPTDLLRILSNQMADAVEQVGPSIVLVNGRERQPASGVVYEQDLVLTAAHVLERYIRTDATPYPGFSGGPLIDMQGHVLGILTTGLWNGVALAIPMQIARAIAETLVKQGHIQRGYLGISSQLVEVPAAQRANS